MADRFLGSGGFGAVGPMGAQALQCRKAMDSRYTSRVVCERNMGYKAKRV